MKIGQVFSSYLKADDIGDGAPVVAIREVILEAVGGGPGQEKEHKPVVYFIGKEKGLVLNRTNADTITEIAGTDETDEWPGVRLVLYVDKTVKFQGKSTPAIRVRAPRPATPSKPIKPVLPDDGTDPIDDTPF